MKTRPFRIYADSSVFGGCYDEKFVEVSLGFFEGVRGGRYILLVTEIVLAELAEAPEEVQQILSSLQPALVERIEINEEILTLRDAYIKAGILAKRWVDDAGHVAAATIARADAIISWNFQHIVRLDKMKLYNQINLLNGYGILTIISPKELASYEEEK